MGLSEGNQAWAGTSARKSLNIVHADDSFRLLKRQQRPDPCMLACLAPSLCCVPPFSPAEKGKSGPTLMRARMNFETPGEGTRRSVASCATLKGFFFFSFTWVIRKSQIGATCGDQRRTNYNPERLFCSEQMILKWSRVAQRTHGEGCTVRQNNQLNKSKSQPVNCFY